MRKEPSKFDRFLNAAEKVALAISFVADPNDGKPKPSTTPQSQEGFELQTIARRSENGDQGQNNNGNVR
jgi:hypothetical protein